MRQPDPARQEQARRYALLRRRIFVAELLLGGAYLLAVIALGLPIAVRGWLTATGGGQAFAVAGMFALLSLAYGLLSAPLGYYSGYLLPHRFRLSTQGFAAWLTDLAKGAAVSFVLGLIVVELVYYLLAAFPTQWWLLAGVGMLIFTVVLSNLAPILLVPLFYKLTPLADADLADRLMRLAAKAGARVRGVYTMNMSSKTTAANAALMGLGNTRRIVLGDTLLARYDRDEIETVLAHELGHHVHGDIPKGIAVQSCLTLAGFYLSDVALRLGIGAFGYQGAADVAGMPQLALVLGALSVVAMPLGNAFSRHIEARADRYALRATRKPDAFARAMIKLADQNLAEFSPPRWVELLFHSHPPPERRVRLAEDFGRQELA